MKRDYPTQESNIIEFKEVSQSKLPKDLWETISAFSNSEGGDIYLGINKDSQAVGINQHYLDGLQSDLITQCSQQYNQPLYPDVRVDRNNIIKVVLQPAPAAFRPIYLKRKGPINGGRVRMGTSNIQLDTEWIKRFAIAAQGGAEVQIIEGDYRHYFSIGAIEEYLRVLRTKRGPVYGSLETEEILIKMRALTNDSQMTWFGLLAFSGEWSLQELTAPTVNVSVTQYRGTTKVNPADISESHIDDREINGSVINQFEESLDFILSKLPATGRIGEGGRRKSYPAIPEIAIREVLANAIVHRDYTTMTGRIQVDLYFDRIEFANPGRSLVPLEQIDSTHSDTRNPLLMAFLKDLGITEQRARGIPTIRQSLAAAGLPIPKFHHRNDRFVATLYMSTFIDQSDQEWLRKFQPHRLSERQLKALIYVKNHEDGINNKEYREINNMTSVHDDDRAKRELTELVGLSILTTTGAKRNRRYIIPLT